MSLSLRLANHRIAGVVEDTSGAADVILRRYESIRRSDWIEFLTNDMLKLVGYRVDLPPDSASLRLWDELSGAIDACADETPTEHEANLRCLLRSLGEKELLAMIGLSILEQPAVGGGFEQKPNLRGVSPRDRAQ